MKLYIPEIGDTLTLTKDWIFLLVLERRNEKMITHIFPDYTFTYNWSIPEIFGLTDSMDNRHFLLLKTKMKELNDKLWEITRDYRGKDYYEKREEYYQKIRDFFTENKEDVILPSYENMHSMLPKGTELKVSRIYIRQGASSYSSVTFYAKLPGSKKSIRFFAKLRDVNKIEFDEEAVIKAPDKKGAATIRS